MRMKNIRPDYIKEDWFFELGKHLDNMLIKYFRDQKHPARKAFITSAIVPVARKHGLVADQLLDELLKSQLIYYVMTTKGNMFFFPFYYSRKNTKTMLLYAAELAEEALKKAKRRNTKLTLQENKVSES